MAVVKIRPLKISGGRSKAGTLKIRTDYSMNPEKTVNIHARDERNITLSNNAEYSANPDKTDGGLLIKSYECDPRTVVEEFMLTKKQYEYQTGRDQGKRDILAYRIIQSFAPGEIEPEKALEVGYELGLRWTKGNHAFIVSVHTDKAHVHCHIDYNSTRLDGLGKFNNFKNSYKALQRLSDMVCLEHSLSVIENPGATKGKTYAEWLGKSEPSWQDKLRHKIDEVLPACASFDDFITAMKTAGYTVNDKRKHITLQAPGQKKPSRLNTLGGNHTEAAIRERLAGKTMLASSSTSGVQGRFNLLIDIQAKIQAGKGAGYENWARIFNLKEAAKTLLFLKENGIDSYEDLKKKASSASSDFATLTKKIKEAEQRMGEISELQKQIGTYGKTRDVFTAYRKSGYSEAFYEENRTDITLHRGAKKFFDGLGYGKEKKLPTISSLKQEYAALLAEKKRAYAGYRELKETSRSLTMAKSNADRILGITPQAHERNLLPQKEKRSTAHDR